MAQEIRRSYRFAFFTSLLITVFVSLLFLIFQFVFYAFEAIPMVICAAGTYVFSFLIIQLRVEHFIYKRVKQVYDKVSLLDSSSLRSEQITTDMNSLTREVEKFAEGKKVEIESLKIRENYRKEFMGNVSHELRTPLFTVQGYIMTLLDGAMNDEKILKKYLKRANKGVERLTYIVNDLDMITKLEMGEMHLDIERFDITKLIQGVFDLLEMKATKKDIVLTFDLEYDRPLFVTADRERVQQVVINLIVNSIKYGKEGGTTEVSIEDLTDHKFLICITDNGEGIEQKNIKRIFERFYRVDKSGSRKEGGSGLGLSIVKHILEALNEKLYVESDFGVGSEFSFTLEKADKPKKPADKTKERRKRFKGKS
jgi:two-component system phosphate regulon sensor histidine kinase PhoR